MRFEPEQKWTKPGWDRVLEVALNDKNGAKHQALLQNCGRSRELR